MEARTRDEGGDWFVTRRRRPARVREVHDLVAPMRQKKNIGSKPSAFPIAPAKCAADHPSGHHSRLDKCRLPRVNKVLGVRERTEKM